MNNVFLKILPVFLVLCIGIISNSIAVSAFLLFIDILGFLIIFLLKNKDLKTLISVFQIAFIFISLCSLAQWIGHEYDITVFNNLDNDQYKFWLESQIGASSDSFVDIYNYCFVEPNYFENKGYYLYIQTLAYLAKEYFDGNHLLLQILGSSSCVALSSIFIFLLLRKYFDATISYKYSLIYILCTPFFFNSLLFLRDPLVSFLYLVIIYLCLCRKFSIVNLCYQLFLVYILLFIRNQHGLFACIFIALSVYLSKSKYKWVFYTALLFVLVVFGITFFSHILAVFDETSSYYNELTNDFLSSTNSGLGRYVFLLPSPIKEVARIILLQMQFPPWLGLTNANNIFHGFTAFFELIGYVFWFYVFTYTCFAFWKIGFKHLPKDMLCCAVIFTIFIALNSSNLIVRRVICVYPLLYIVFVLYKTQLSTIEFNTSVKNNFILLYTILCISYFILSAVFS